MKFWRQKRAFVQKGAGKTLMKLTQSRAPWNHESLVHDAA